MNLDYTAVLRQEGDSWSGWIEEVPGAYCQEDSPEALRETPAITLKEALELSRQDALSAAGIDYTEEKIVLSA